MVNDSTADFHSLSLSRLLNKIRTELLPYNQQAIHFQFTARKILYEQFEPIHHLREIFQTNTNQTQTKCNKNAHIQLSVWSIGDWIIRSRDRHRIATDKWIPKRFKTHLTAHYALKHWENFRLIIISCFNLFIIYGLLRSVWCVWLLISYMKIKEPSQAIILYCPVININAIYIFWDQPQYYAHYTYTDLKHVTWTQSFMLAIRFMINFHIMHCMSCLSSDYS